MRWVAECSHPLHIRATEVHTATGEVRQRSLLRRCGTRLASRCESCSELYAGDAREVIRSGTTDGGAFTWLTLTAPGADVFGAVHSGPSKRGRRRCACGRYHRADDARLGTPVDPDTYDHDASARFNATLSRRFTVLMQKLRRLTGEPLDFVRVVEFQRRGLTHVHALVRGAVSPESLRVAVRGGINPRTGRRVAAVTSGGFGFGPQCDAQPVVDVGRVGAYMRKLIHYAVKAAGDDLPDGSRHARAMARAGARSVGCSDNHRGWCRDEPGRLNDPSWGSCRRHRAARRGWGFRGHVLAASRRWGVKFSALRAARRAWVAALSGPSRWATLAFEVLPPSLPRPSWLRGRSP